MRWDSLFLAGFAIAAFACGGKIAPGTSVSDVDACTLPSVCTLISSTEVSEAMGGQFSAGVAQLPDRSSESGCSFESVSRAGPGMPETTEAEVTVLFDCPQQSSDDVEAQFEQAIPLGAIHVSGLGDDAIWVPQSNVLAVVKGQNAFAVAIVYSSEGPDEMQAQDTAIARDVIANL